MLRLHELAFWSNRIFKVSCFARTLACTDGNTANMGVFIMRPISYWHVGTPVVLCWIVWYLRRIRAIFVAGFPAFMSFSLVLNAWTALSASPLEAGWKGALVICVMLFFSQKRWNCSLVKEGPLSDTNVSGTPWVSNSCRNPSIVASDVAVWVIATSPIWKMRPLQSSSSSQAVVPHSLYVI